MLKVECLNNSLWNHLDKTIVVSIVQRLESDRMRQKGETPQGLPLQVCSEMGRKEVAYLSFSLFPRGSFNNRAPSSGQLPKRGCCITDDWQLSQAGACCECPATIFFLIAYCLRGVPTGYSRVFMLLTQRFRSGCIWKLGCLYEVSGQSPSQRPGSLFWHLLLISWALLNFVIDYRGQSMECRGKKIVVYVWQDEYVWVFLLAWGI